MMPTGLYPLLLMTVESTLTGAGLLLLFSANELPAISQWLELPFIAIGLPVRLLRILLPVIVTRSALWKTMLASGTATFVPSMTFPLTTTSWFPPSPTIAEPSHCLITLPVIVWREVPEESSSIPIPRAPATDLTPSPDADA